MSRSSLFSLPLVALLVLATGCPESVTAPVATSIAANSAATQSAVAGAVVPTPPSVKVLDANGNGMANIVVTFAVASGGGSITGASATTNSSGVATVGSWTLGTTAGANSLNATSGTLTGSPVTFTATGVAGPAAALVLNLGNAQSAIAGASVAVPPSVRVNDANGNAVQGTTVTFAVASGGGTVTAPAATSNSSGAATVGSWTLGTTAGPNTLTATATGLTGSPVVFTATGTAGSATAMTLVAGNNQSATAGAAVAVTPAVLVADANGNGVAGRAVVFAVASGGGTITGGSATTNSSGIASVGSWALGGTAGPNTLTATSTGLTGSPVTFTATGNPGPAASMVVNDGNSQSGIVGAPLSISPSVKVLDATGNPVAGTAVTFAVTAGGGVLTGEAQISNAGGVAAVGSWTLGNAAGAHTMTASAAGLTGSPITFTASAAAGTSGATQLAVATQPAGAVTGVNLITQPIVQVRSASNSLVTTATSAITASVSSGTGVLSGTTTVNAVAGVAAFTNLRITGTGPTTLRFTSPGLTTATANSFTVTSVGTTDPCLTVPTISMPGTASGSLATSDCRDTDGYYIDQYRLTLGATTSVQMALDASFDAFLIVLNAAGTVVTYDDDNGAGTNSLLTATLPAGTYTILATSYDPGETGTYTLALSAPVGDPCSATATTIAVGGTANGTLAATDCHLTSGQYADRFQFTLSSSATVRIDLTSTAFDSYLFLTTSAGVAVGEDDDGGAGSNSQIQATLPAGTYIIWTTSYLAAATGAYTLAVTTPSTACSTATSIAVGASASGTLANTDCPLSDGSFADRWQFTVASAQTVTVSMTSSAFDAYLYLVNSAGTVVATDDDGAGGTNARIAAPLTAGTYTIYASSYGAAATGAYQLSLSVPASACGTPTNITVGQTLSGALASTDCQQSDGTYVDRWQVTLSASTALTISMTSTAFDTYMYLLNSSGSIIAEDDDGAGGTNSRIQGTFAAGTYTIYTSSFNPNVTGAYQLAVAGTTPTSGGPVNLRVENAYLIQSTQSPAGTVPIIGNRDALLRVFVRADQTNNATPSVRVRFYQGTTVVDTRTITAPGSSTPTTLSEGVLTSTWNVVVPASVIQPSVKMLIDVDPANTVAESNETDNTFPASGTAQTVDVRTAPTFRITLIPVNQSVNGKIGSVTSGTLSSFLTMTRAVWPLASIDAVVGSTYTTSLPALQSSDGNGSWSALLNEIAAKRAAEAPTRYYYGVVKVGYTSGIAGLGRIGRPAAIGWDYAGADEVMAHELGHNFNRLHANCGGPANPDPNFPYANAAIGVYGYNGTTNVLRAPSSPDLMSYCSSPWISDYTFKSALDFLKSQTLTAMSGPVESVLLWGRIEDGTMILEPAVELVAYPTAKPAPGPFRLEGSDASGNPVVSFAFTPDDVGDGARTAQQFAFIIPKSELGGRDLAALRLTRAGMKTATQAAVSVAPGVGSATATSVVRRSDGAFNVTWDAARFPIAVVRSATTGEILSFARGGSVSLGASVSAVDLVLSNGVRSTTQRMVIPR